MYNNILDIIGNTPLVRLNTYLTDSNVELYAKLEGGNPGGSVKDRTAKFMIEDAESRGILSQDRVLLEATSGNTGIALAMIATMKGYRFTAVMPDNVSVERRKLLAAFGSEIILTPGHLGTNGAIEVAGDMAARDDRYLMLDQFSNPANVRAHYETTGAEIVRELPQITAFVAGMGTGGTLMGVARRLKEHNPSITVVGLEPSPDSGIQGLRNMEAYNPPIFDAGKLDLCLRLPDEPSFRLARELYVREGVSVGISSGAALWGALEYARNIDAGVIVMIFPDRGDKYLSTDLFP
jgi:cysteine synthase